MSRPEFEAFPKIPRLRGQRWIVTEKIDGTNACVYISEEGEIHAASRSRWITPTDDNYGFARWVSENEEELRKLGPGRHFGEWWGAGIQRRYGLTEKRFSLFNAGRWGNAETRPACCGVVPVLGQFAEPGEAADTCMRTLREGGSVAAPGFMDPEGIVIFHTASGNLYKHTFEAGPKGKGAP